MLGLMMWLGCGQEAAVPEPAASPEGEEVAALQPIKVALNWYPEPEFGGFYEGVSGGHYAEAGLDVEILPGGPGAPTLELLTSGKVQVAITTAEDLLVKRSRGVQAIGVWAGMQWTPTGLMVHASSGIERFEDIQSGQVAIEIGSPFQTFLWKNLDWEGKVLAVPYGGSVGPFLSDPKGIQQAYITSEPCAAKAEGAEVSFLKASDAGWNPYGVLVALPDPMPRWGPAFVQATAAAWEAYLEDPAPAHETIQALNPQMKGDFIDCIFEAQEPFLKGRDGLGVLSADRWKTLENQLKELELLPQDASAEGAWIPLLTPERPAASPEKDQAAGE